MNLEEIRKLNDEELGRRLAEKAGLRVVKESLGFRYYIDGLSRPTWHLATDLDAVDEIIQIVIKDSPNRFHASLYAILGETYPAFYNMDKIEQSTMMITSSARDRASACLSCLIFSEREGGE